MTALTSHLSVLHVLVLALATTATTATAQASRRIVRIDGAEAVAGEYLVRYRPSVARDAAAASAASAGVEIVRFVAPANAYLVRESRGRALATQALGGEPMVEILEPNWVYRRQAAPAPPDDPRFGSLWGLDNTGQDGGRADADIDAPEAWAIRSDAGTIVVAVIDSGIDLTHPDLVANLWTNPGEIPANGVDDDGDGRIDDIHGWDFTTPEGGPPIDEHRHGTHVAGTIGARGNNAIGVSGVSHRVKLMACKFLDRSGSGTLEGALGATAYAIDHGARVFNNSWAGGGPSELLRELVEKSNARGVVYVAAAGNDGSDNDRRPVYPASYPLANVIAVAALDRKERKAGFSNHGLTSVHLGAPGDEILSTLPLARGSYGELSGTSMAAPHVAGAVALLLAEMPALTPAEVKERLARTVDPAPALAGKTVSGGRLNAHKLLTGEPGQPLPPASDGGGCGGGSASPTSPMGLALPLLGVVLARGVSPGGRKRSG